MASNGFTGHPQAALLSQIVGQIRARHPLIEFKNQGCPEITRLPRCKGRAFLLQPSKPPCLYGESVTETLLNENVGMARTWKLGLGLYPVASGLRSGEFRLGSSVPGCRGKSWQSSQVLTKTAMA